MIILDTHVWIWLTDESDRLSSHHKRIIQERRSEGLGISVMSCWEVAKLVELGRLRLSCSVEEWIDEALALPDIQLIEFSSKMGLSSSLCN